MTVVIDSKTSKKDLKKALKKIKPKFKKFDASKFFGKISFKGDPLEIQREMRDE